jgi:hypothetical protein
MTSTYFLHEIAPGLRKPPARKELFILSQSDPCEAMAYHVYNNSLSGTIQSGHAVDTRGGSQKRSINNICRHITCWDILS